MYLKQVDCLLDALENNQLVRNGEVIIEACPVTEITNTVDLGTGKISFGEMWFGQFAQDFPQ